LRRHTKEALAAYFLEADEEVGRRAGAACARVKVGRCRLKPADPPELKGRWLRKLGRLPMDHYFLTLIYLGGPLCTMQCLKATCDEAL